MMIQRDRREFLSLVACPRLSTIFISRIHADTEREDKYLHNNERNHLFLAYQSFQTHLKLILERIYNAPREHTTLRQSYPDSGPPPPPPPPPPFPPPSNFPSGAILAVNPCLCNPRQYFIACSFQQVSTVACP